MRVVILGAGEAFDETVGNTSALVSDGANLLLDCGYAAPFQVWRHGGSEDLLDAIYISHAHADHYFGLPALLTRMWEEGRTKPLTLISQRHVLAQIRQVVDLGYAGIAKKFQFPIEEMEASPSAEVSCHGFRMRFAPTVHSVTNLAVRIDVGGEAFCYSGDGMFTAESRALCEGAALLLHEGFSFEESPVHTDIPRLIAMAGEIGVRHLVLTHVQRRVRKDEARMRSLSAKVRLTLARPGDCFEVGGETRDHVRSI